MTKMGHKEHHYVYDNIETHGKQEIKGGGTLECPQKTSRLTNRVKKEKRSLAGRSSEQQEH